MTRNTETSHGGSINGDFGVIMKRAFLLEEVHYIDEIDDLRRSIGYGIEWLDEGGSLLELL